MRKRKGKVSRMEESQSVASPNRAQAPTSTAEKSFILGPNGDKNISTLPHSEYKNVVHGGQPNRVSWKGWKLIFFRVLYDFSHNDLLDRGATLTFFTILTSAPTLLAAFSLISLFLANNEAQILRLSSDFIEEYVPDEWNAEVETIVETVIGSATQNTIMLVISIVLALVSSSAYVRAFSRGANAVYGRAEGRGFFKLWSTMWVVASWMVAGLVVMFVAVMLQRSIIEPLVGPIADKLGLSKTLDFLLTVFLPIWDWLRWPAVILIALALISVLYQFAPNAQPGKFRWISWGSTIALLGSAVTWLLVSLYLSTLGSRSAYGALGTIITGLAALWAINTMLVVGIKVDAEIQRVRELQRGIESEDMIQVPPRAEKLAYKQQRRTNILEDRSRAIREFRSDDGIAEESSKDSSAD